MVAGARSPTGRSCCTARREERDALRRLLGAVRDGQSRVLGRKRRAWRRKDGVTAVRDRVGVRVIRAVGLESEMELPVPTLQHLCAPMLDRLDRLRPPQQDALRVGFDLRAGAGSTSGRVGVLNPGPAQ